MLSMVSMCGWISDEHHHMGSRNWTPCIWQHWFYASISFFISHCICITLIADLFGDSYNMYTYNYHLSIFMLLFESPKHWCVKPKIVCRTKLIYGSFANATRQRDTTHITWFIKHFYDTCIVTWSLICMCKTSMIYIQSYSNCINDS